MHASTATLRAGGICRSPLSKEAAYCRLLSISWSVTLMSESPPVGMVEPPRWSIGARSGSTERSLAATEIDGAAAGQLPGTEPGQGSRPIERGRGARAEYEAGGGFVPGSVRGDAPQRRAATRAG